METTKFELDASERGWRCSSCGLLIDAIGRAIFGNEPWTVTARSTSWIENKPDYNFCPKCGRKVERDCHG